MKRIILSLILILSQNTWASDSFTLGEWVDQKMPPEVQTEFDRDLEADTGLRLTQIRSIQLQFDADTATLTLIDPTIPKKHLFYIGASLGAIFPLGIEAIYVYQSHNKTVLHAEADFQRNPNFKSVGLAAAYHPTQKGGFFVGAEAKNLIIPFDEDHSFNQPAAGPQVGWQKPFAQQKFMGSLSIGVLKSFNSWDGMMTPQPTMLDLKLTISLNPPKLIKGLVK